MEPSKEFNILVKVIGGITIVVGVVAFISRNIVDIIYFIIMLFYLVKIICSKKYILD